MILKQALANPKIGFKFQANGKELLNIKPELNSDDLFLNRITNIMGQSFTEEAIKINNFKPIKEEKFAKIHGLISLPTMNKSNHNQQYLFVNGRCIQDRNLSGAIRAAYRDTLPKGRFPLFCLFIEVPSEFIDVNVHPGKTEVRFQDNALIRSLLVGSISRELNASFSRTTGDISKEAITRFETYKNINIENYVNETQTFFENNKLSPSIKSIKSINEENPTPPNDQQDDFPKFYQKEF